MIAASRPPAPEAGSLPALRGEIERIDRAIVELIAQRVRVARQVAPLKRARKMPVLDPPREAAVVRRAGALAREAGIDDEAVRALFWNLVGLCRRAQMESG